MYSSVSPSKASGAGETFAESIRLIPDKMANLLTELWRAVSRCGVAPSSWTEVCLYPIHEAGDRSDAGNYRPIGLLSHVRKVVDRALDTAIREVTNFHWTQTAFRKGKGTEHPILRLRSATKAGHNAIAVLVIKGAYPSIPRPVMMKVLQERLPESLVNMVSVLMVPNRVQTVGDDTNHHRTMTVGLIEGDPKSPALFNLVMDILGQQLAASPSRISMLPANIFAYDVLLMSRTIRGLQ